MVEIFTLSGRKAKVLHTENLSSIIHRKEYQPAVYVYKILLDQNEYLSGKFILK